MLFKAAARNENLYSNFYEFEIGDCPVLITSRSLILQKHPDSLILDLGTVVRGDEETGIFEGDYVWEDDKLLGIVIYNKGFVLQNYKGEVKDIPRGEHIQVINGSRESCIFAVKSKRRQKILFMFKTSIIDFSCFVASRDNKLLTVNSNRWVDVDEIKLCSGCLTENNQTLCFDDIYQGGYVAMHDYKVCSKKLDGSYTLI